MTVIVVGATVLYFSNSAVYVTLFESEDLSAVHALVRSNFSDPFCGELYFRDGFICAESVRVNTFV